MLFRILTLFKGLWYTCQACCTVNTLRHTYRATSFTLLLVPYKHELSITSSTLKAAPSSATCGCDRLAQCSFQLDLHLTLCCTTSDHVAIVHWGLHSSTL